MVVMVLLDLQVDQEAVVLAVVMQRELDHRPLRVILVVQAVEVEIGRVGEGAVQVLLVVMVAELPPVMVVMVLLLQLQDQVCLEQVEVGEQLIILVIEVLEDQVVVDFLVITHPIQVVLLGLLTQDRAVVAVIPHQVLLFILITLVMAVLG
jgi:hypothetical protein